MTTATAPAPITPIADWDDSPITGYSSAAHAAGSVAWGLLTHSAHDAIDVGALMAVKKPAVVEEDDVFSLLHRLITDAGRIGYLASKLDQVAFQVPYWGETGEVRISDVAKAIAAMIHRPLIEDSPVAEEAVA